MANDKESKKISVPVAAAVGLGAIIGAGIFVLSGTAIALAGYDALIAFVLVGIVAIIIALELGELGSLMPNLKGASYSYTYKAFGSELGFITGMLRYIALATSISAISLGFGSYLASTFGLPINTYGIPFAIALIGVLSAVNMFGVKKAAEADFWLVIVKLGVLFVFIAFAMAMALTGANRSAGAFTFSTSGGAISGIFAASIVVFFAYSGFQTISSITDRIRGGSMGYVKAIMAAVLISMIVYVLVVYALLLLLPAAAYKISADPLAFALKSSNAPGWLTLLTDIGALVATASATIAMILSSSRALYQMSLDHLLPKSLRKYDKRRDTAGNGILVSAVIGVIMLFAGNIYVIASIANFGMIFNYLMIGFALVHFRRGRSNPGFSMPLYPYLTIVGEVMLFAFLIGMPKEALVFGTIAIMSLLIVYYALRELQGKKVIRIRLFR